MSKTEFLHILREKLSILDENELADILSEYEQHIDMKAAGAMTEEAAIADFGDIDELTSDILKAYHVRTDFTPGSGQTAVKGSFMVSVQDFFTNMGNSISRGYKKLLAAFGSAGQFISRQSHRFSETCQKLFTKKTPQADMVKATEEKKRPPILKWERPKEKRVKVERRRISVFSVIGGMFTGCCKAFLWCMIVLWNIFCASAAVMAGLLSCAFIFCIGLLAVLQLQGYPLMGIMIAFLGVTMCACSATIWLFTLIIRRRNRKETVMGDMARMTGDSAQRPAETEAAVLSGEEESVNA